MFTINRWNKSAKETNIVIDVQDTIINGVLDTIKFKEILVLEKLFGQLQ
jgi:hypothetical protein